MSTSGDDEVVNVIQTAVAAWARRAFATNEVAIGEVALDEEVGRLLVDLAARPVSYWLVVEVWLEHGRVVAVNDLGEGLPLNGAGGWDGMKIYTFGPALGCHFSGDREQSGWSSS
jgi:hypothetical protein